MWKWFDNPCWHFYPHVSSLSSLGFEVHTCRSKAGKCHNLKLYSSHHCHHFSVTFSCQQRKDAFSSLFVISWTQTGSCNSLKNGWGTVAPQTDLTTVLGNICCNFHSLKAWLMQIYIFFRHFNQLHKLIEAKFCCGVNRQLKIDWTPSTGLHDTNDQVFPGVAFMIQTELSLLL